MYIRKAKCNDINTIIDLLSQLGYPNSESFIHTKLKSLLSDPNEYILVAENGDKKVVGFISIHIIPQIALEGDFARISYLVVDREYISFGIGKLLEEQCEQIARERNCDRIEVHCNSIRTEAHKFYYKRGYLESPKYLIKKLR